MSESGLVYISGADWPNFKAMMEKLKNLSAMASDKTLAFIGSEGRKRIGKEEEKEFEFGQTYTKWKGKNNSQTKIRSIMDSTHGWYKGSDGTRMIGFSYENALTYQKKTMRKLNNTMSVGYVYSLMANLWNNPTKPYSKPSAPFRKQGSDRIGGWGLGATRPARIGLRVKTVQEAVAPALARATDEFQRMIIEEGLG